MRTVKILLAYDGTEFAGWQRQKEGPSVQKSLEDALFQVLGTKTKVLGAGRTDRGVHALGQVATFRTSSNIPTERIPSALNAKLPPVVRVLEAEEVPKGFHPSLRAKAKHYRYTIFTGNFAPPHLRNLVLAIKYELDGERMLRAAKHMVGKKDWRAFKTRAKGQEHYCTVKDIKAIGFTKVGSFWILDFLGSGFLHKQVRTMVGTLIEVGRGRFGPEEVEQIVASGDRTRAGPTVQPHGLCLMQVFYKEAPEQWWEVGGPAIWFLPERPQLRQVVLPCGEPP